MKYIMITERLYENVLEEKAFEWKQGTNIDIKQLKNGKIIYYLLSEKKRKKTNKNSYFSITKRTVTPSIKNLHLLFIHDEIGIYEEVPIDI